MDLKFALQHFNDQILKDLIGLQSSLPHITFVSQQTYVYQNFRHANIRQIVCKPLDGMKQDCILCKTEFFHEVIKIPRLQGKQF